MKHTFHALAARVFVFGFSMTTATFTLAQSSNSEQEAGEGPGRQSRASLGCIDLQPDQSMRTVQVAKGERHNGECCSELTIS